MIKRDVTSHSESKLWCGFGWILRKGLLYIQCLDCRLLVIGLHWRLLLVKQPRLSLANISTVLQTCLNWSDRIGALLQAHPKNYERDHRIIPHVHDFPMHSQCLDPISYSTCFCDFPGTSIDLFDLLLRYEGRDKTARFVQFAARFIVGLLARVAHLPFRAVGWNCEIWDFLAKTKLKSFPSFRASGPRPWHPSSTGGSTEAAGSHDIGQTNLSPG